MNPDTFLEVVLRGMTAGMLLLTAVHFLRVGKSFDTAHMGALFAFGTAGYALLSSPAIADASGPFFGPLVVLSTLNSVFFWWFATILFDDEFEWRAWRLLPFVIIGLLAALRVSGSGAISNSLDNYVQQPVVIAMMLHILWLAAAHWNDDLIETRRRFRLVFSVLAGLVGLGIALVELTEVADAPPPALTLFHGALLFTLTFGFLQWLLRPASFLNFVPEEKPQSKTSAVRPDNMAPLSRLTKLMEDGIHREQDLTIAVLAEKVGVPEHRLRHLINQELGFRNFSAFLNEKRIEEARTLLADPEQAQRQVIQIALDLGYGSVGPFNRAFRAATDMTPTQFRTKALSERQQEAELKLSDTK